MTSLGQVAERPVCGGEVQKADHLHRAATDGFQPHFRHWLASVRAKADYCSMGRRYEIQRVRRTAVAAMLLCLLGSGASAQAAPGGPPGSSEAQAAKRAEWMALFDKAVAEIEAGRIDAGVTYVEQALRLAEQIFGANDSYTQESVKSLAPLYLARHRYAEAEPLYIRAIAASERLLGKDHPNTLSLAGELARTYQSLGRYADAEPLYARALAVTERVAGSDHQDTLTAINNLAGIYGRQGRHADAERLYLRGLEASERVRGKDDVFTLTFVQNLANIYVREGRYADAEPLYLRTLAASERRSGMEHADTLDSLRGLGFLYRSQGRYAEAEALLARALAGSERTLGKEHPDTLGSVDSLAQTYKLQGRNTEAVPLFARVLDARERLLGKDHPATLESVNNLATNYEDLGRYADAESLYKRAVAANEIVLGKEHPNTLTSVNNLAGNHARQGRYGDAELLFARVLEARERILGKEHPATLRAYSSLTANLLSDPSSAKRAIGPARALVARIRSRRSSADASAFANAQNTRETKRQVDDFILFVELAWIAVERGTESRREVQREAFTALQEAIAGMAGKAMGQMAVRRAAEGQAAGLGALVRQRQDLAELWDTNASQFGEAAADAGPVALARRATLTDARQRIEGEMDRIDARLRAQFPDYFAIVRPEPLDVGATQKLLRPDEAILLAVQNYFGTHVIAVSKTDIKWARSEWTSERVAAAVKRLLWDVGADNGVSAEDAAKWEKEGGPGYPYDRKTAFALYQQIVTPVESVLAGKRQVSIVTGGVLTSLPFGILVTEPPQGADGDPQTLRDTKWFSDAHTLVTIPSIQSLQMLRNAATAVRAESAALGAGFAGYGDPNLDGQALTRGARSGRGRSAQSVFRPGQSRSGAGVANVDELRSLARLPGTATELEGMRVALSAPVSAVHLQQAATEAAIRSADLSNVHVLALATHGVIAGELTGTVEPGLVFTPPEQASDQDDGYLTASEVSAMKLNADWVILSACNTAAGDGSEGAPGLSGLARAFFYAGARNLLVSHWPVRDDVAARLTVDTIRRQAADPKLSRAEAFQQAMRAIRNEASHDSATDTWAHPNAWAPFSLIGDGAR